jgi:NAD(P)H-hydrate epimerase
MFEPSRVVTVDEMRALERAAIRAGTSEADLMSAAGRVVADALAAWLPRTDRRRLLVLAGKGNNGGDALIAARHLHERYGMRVTLYLLAERKADPLLDWAGASKPHAGVGRGAGVRRERDTGAIETLVHTAGRQNTLRTRLDAADVVLDGILGIGARLPLEGAIADVLDVLGRHRPPGQRRVAVDVPTGIDADTGQADPRALHADLTLATGPAKPGLFIHPGAGHAGRVMSLDIGLSDDSAERAARLTAHSVAGLLPTRCDDSHKGTYGKLLVIAGSARYFGAAALTATAAVRSGAGLVTLAAPADVRHAVASQSAEITYLPLPDDPAAPGCLTPGHLGQLLDAARGYDALALGPGLGVEPATRRLVTLLAEHLAADERGPRCVIDADALNALASVDQADRPHPRAARWVLTPHPGEMARLRGLEPAAVQGDRLRTALDAAREWRQSVVLKGAPSLVAAPDGRLRLSPFANAALAVAGTGDVLTGLIGALLSQGLDPFDAAAAGTFVHGLAGELWRTEYGSAGLAATDLAHRLPAALQHLHSL